MKITYLFYSVMITIYNSLTDISTATAQGKITAMFGAFTAHLMHM